MGQPPIFNTVTKRCRGPASCLPHGHQKMSWASLLPSTWPPKNVWANLPPSTQSPKDVVGQPLTFLMVTRRSHGPTSCLQHGHQKMLWANFLPSTCPPEHVDQPPTFNMATKICVGQPPTFHVVSRRCCGPTSHLPHGHQKMLWASLLSLVNLMSSPKTLQANF